MVRIKFPFHTNGRTTNTRKLNTRTRNPYPFPSPLEVTGKFAVEFHMEKDYSLYLRVGDRVIHKRYTRWGMGVVTEERNSELPGGFCYVRIVFQDGKMRVFDNNFKSNNCCYYAGVQLLDEMSLE